MKHQLASLKTIFLNLMLLAIGFIFVSLSGCKKPKNDDNGDQIQPMYGVRMSVYKPIIPCIRNLQLDDKIKFFIDGKH